MGAGFFAPLVAAADEFPEWPWLFYREKMDWRWRSFRQVADHLARATATVASQPEPCWAYSGRCAVDALMAGWAVLAAGKVALPWWAPEAPPYPFTRVDSAKDPEPAPPGVRDLLLPPVNSGLVPYTNEPLVVLPGGRLQLAPGVEFELAALEMLVEELDLALPDRPRQAPTRQIWHLGSQLGPRLDHAVLALCLRRHAALALEPYPEATVASILWCRPSLVVATPREVDDLAAAFDRSAARHSRLEGILVAGAPSATQLASWEQLFDVPVHPFPPI